MTTSNEIIISQKEKDGCRKVLELITWISVTLTLVTITESPFFRSFYKTPGIAVSALVCRLVTVNHPSYKTQQDAISFTWKPVLSSSLDAS